MQSHPSRHVVSEHLKDRHPDLSPAFPSGHILGEVANGYGRRAVPKLVEVLSLPDSELEELSGGNGAGAECRAHCLRTLLRHMSNQEEKTMAVTCGAAAPAVRLAGGDGDAPAVVRKLSRDLCGALATLLVGRAALIAAGVVKALSGGLSDDDGPARDAAAKALSVLSTFPDGAEACRRDDCGVVALCKACLDDAVSSPTAKLGVAFSLRELTRTCDGVEQALVARIAGSIARECSDRSNAPELHEACAGAIGNMCRTASVMDYGRVQTLEEGALPALTSVLSTSKYSGARRAAAGALAAMALEDDARLAVQEIAGAALLVALSDSDEGCAENAKIAILHTSELPAARSLALSVMTADQRQLVFGYA